MTENETMFRLLADVDAKVGLAGRTVKQYRRPGLDRFTEDFLNRVRSELLICLYEYSRSVSADAVSAAAVVYKEQERVVTNG